MAANGEAARGAAAVSSTVNWSGFMAPRGAKPKPAKLRLVEGTHNVTRHGPVDEARKAVAAAVQAFGKLERPRGLSRKAQKAWAQYIAPASWLDGSREPAAIAFCELWAEFMEAPHRFPSSKHGQMRAYMSELGLTDERNRKDDGGESATSSSTTDRATAYAKRVVSGAVVAGPHVRNACRRHLDDLKHGKKRGLRYDPEAAARAIRFFETKLRLSEGQFEGKPSSCMKARTSRSDPSSAGSAATAPAASAAPISRRARATASRRSPAASASTA
jgi:hypothetical protein